MFNEIDVDQKGRLEGPEIFELAKRSFPGDVTWNFDGAFVFGADGAPLSRTASSSRVARTRDLVSPLLGAPLGRFSLRSADLSYASSLVRKAVATAR